MDDGRETLTCDLCGERHTLTIDDAADLGWLPAYWLPSAWPEYGPTCIDRPVCPGCAARHTVIVDGEPTIKDLDVYYGRKQAE